MIFPKNERIIDKKAVKNCKEIGFCQICGHPGNDPHHIVTKGSGGPDHKYNLICLCRKCQSAVHNGIYSKDYLFAIVFFREFKKIDEETIYRIMRGEQ